MNATEQKTPSVTITKHIAAPREEVFAAWSNPKIMMQWLDAGEGEVRRIDMDFRVGGKFLIDMWGEHEGKLCGGDHVGEYLEITPPEKLVFTWISEYTGNKSSVVSIEFVDKDGGTDLRLTHSQLPTQELADMHGQGWIQFGDLLNEFIVAGAGAILKMAYDKIKTKISSPKAAQTSD